MTDTPRDDLVKRLRWNATNEDCLNDPYPGLLLEAADYISRSRDEALEEAALLSDAFFNGTVQEYYKAVGGKPKKLSDAIRDLKIAAPQTFQILGGAPGVTTEHSVSKAAATVVVPREPTPEMCAAGFCVSEAEHDPAGVYRAMLAAAQVVPMYPTQCKCGHIFLEKYQFPKPTPEGVIGFCWCGFCRTRLNVLAAAQGEGKT